VISSVFAVLLFISTYRACNLYDKNSILKGKDEIITAQLNEAIESLNKFESDNLFLLAELKHHEEASTAAIEAANVATNAMQHGLRTVGELKANAENDKALIADMEIEINKRDELIGKLVFTIKQQEQRYFTLTQQYKIIERELDLTKLVVEEQLKVIEIKDLRIKGLEKSLGGLKFSGTIKGGLVLGLAAVVVYGLVRK